MKIRMEDNNLRLRLSQPDVEQFRKDGKVSSTTQLGPSTESTLKYTLQKEERAEIVEIDFKGNEIRVLVPLKLADDWVLTEQVGFENKISLNGNFQLYVLVEKDFPCQHKGLQAGKTDLFQNPK